MGQDKALIAVNGVPMLQRVCQVAQQCCDRVYVVTPWPERYQAILPSSCRIVRETPPPEDSESPGPLVGFAQGLAQIQATWVLLLACDLPALRGEALRAWQTQLSAADADTVALLPQHPKGWEPLCGFYRQSCLLSLQAFIEAGGRSFQRWLASEKVQPLAVAERQMLVNCNTPADLAQFADAPTP